VTCPLLLNSDCFNIIMLFWETGCYRGNEGALGWNISDLKGISLAYCMHKIHMQAEYKPVVQPQRRLNPKMKEVVKKQVQKLLDAGMIYSISDSS